MSENEIVTHDDKLVMRGQKHNIGLSESWWKRVPVTGELLGWWNPETGEHRNADEVMGSEEKGFKPVQKRSRMLSDDVYITAEQGFIDIRFSNLWSNLGSRYRNGLEAVVKASMDGIIQYKGEGTTEKHINEAMRNRLKRHWTVVAYEHDLVIMNDEIGQEMMRELRPYTQAEYENTVYLKGFEGTYRKDKPILVKVYNMEPKHGIKAFKLEVTIRNDYIKRHDMRVPNKWLTQPEIQVNIEKALKREWKGVLNMAPKTRGMLADVLEVKQNDLFDFMVSTKHTLTDLVKRMDAQEREMQETRREAQEIKQRLSRLESDKKREW